MLLGARRARRSAASKRRACWSWHATASAGGLRTSARRARSRLLHRRHRREEPAARRRHAADARRHHARRSATTCRRTRTHIDIQFLPQLEGYIWVFPRCGHLSVGICGKGEPARKLRGAPGEPTWRRRASPGRRGSFYSHLLPSLGTAAWRHNRVAGDGLDGRGRRRRAGGPHHRRGPLLRHPLRRPGQPGAALRRARARGQAAAYRRFCSAISPPTWSSARALARRLFRGSFLFASRARSAWFSSCAAARASPT